MKVQFKITFCILLLTTHFCLIGQNKEKAVLDYIEKYKDFAMLEMQEYKIPASITLAQGILESGRGTSELARKGNNHFGIKCHNDWKGKRMYKTDDAPNECFRVYNNASESYRDHSKFLAEGTRYAFLFELKITDYKGWAKGLKKAGYATFPAYANVLINLIENYDLTQYDQMVIKGKFDSKKVKEKIKNDTKNKSNNVSFQSNVKTKVKKENKFSAPPSEFEIVGKTSDGRYIRSNNNVKFIYGKEGEDVFYVAEMLGIYDYQIIKYNDLGKRRVLKDNEIIYIEHKKNKAAKGYYSHTIKQGETLSHVSRTYAIKLNKLFKMNNLDENSILSIGQEIRLR